MSEIPEDPRDGIPQVVFIYSPSPQARRNVSSVANNNTANHSVVPVEDFEQDDKKKKEPVSNELKVRTPPSCLNHGALPGRLHGVRSKWADAGGLTLEGSGTLLTIFLPAGG